MLGRVVDKADKNIVSVVGSEKDREGSRLVASIQLKVVADGGFRGGRMNGAVAKKQGGWRGAGCGGVHGHESWSGRMDGRTQTLKSARAIDAINGCVRLVAGKIDDEQGGTLPSRESERARLHRRRGWSKDRNIDF